MNETLAPQRVETAPAKDVATLERHAAALTAKAAAASRAYDRTVWLKFVAVFLPVPFVVLLLRLHLEAWGYYLAGGLFVTVAVAVFILDMAAVAKRDAAIQAAERAVLALRGPADLGGAPAPPRAGLG